MRLSQRQRIRLELQAALIRRHYPSKTAEFTVLDLGTEGGNTAARIRQEWRWAQCVGVEIHEPTWRKAGERAVYAQLWRECALDFMRRAESLRYDVIVCAELIEHLERREGQELAELVRDKARRLAIVTSPIGLMRQDAIDGNLHQIHRSGWEPSDLERLGYSTFATFPGHPSLFVSYSERT